MNNLIGPTQGLTFLGIQIDSVSLTVQLPYDKLVSLLAVSLPGLIKKNQI